MKSPDSKRPSPKVPRGKPGEFAEPHHTRATSAEFEREGLGVAPKE